MNELIITMQDRNIISLISYKYVLMIELISLSGNIQFIKLQKKNCLKISGGWGEVAEEYVYQTFRSFFLL